MFNFKLKKKFLAQVSVVLSVIMTVLSVQSIVLSADSGNSGEFDALKTAWNNLECTENTEYSVLAYHATSNDGFNGNFFTANKSDFPNGATSDMLGGCYYNFNLNIADGSHVRLLEFFKDSWCQNTTIDLRECDDLYFYIYVNNVNTAGSIKLRLIGSNGDPSSDSNELVINENSVGKWIKVSVNDLYDGGMTAVPSKIENNILKHIRVYVGEGTDAEVTVGNVVASKVAVKPDNFDTISNGKLLAAAERLDVSNYNNAEAFTAAVEAAKAVIGSDQDYAIEKLKDAWGKMETANTTEFNMLAYHSNTAQDGFRGNFFTANKSDFPNGATSSMLGGCYYNFNLNIADGSEPRLLEYFKSIWCERPQIDLRDYTDLYFYLYVKNVNTAGSIKLRLIGSNGDPSRDSNELVIDENSVGKWIKVSVNDLFDGGIAALPSKIENNILNYIRVYIGEGIDAEVSVGNIMVSKKVTLPDGIDSFSTGKLLAMAEKLDISENTNTQNFVSKLVELKAEIGLDEDYLIEGVKDSWQRMSSVKPTEFCALTYHSEAANGFMGNAFTINAGDFPNNATAAMLGNCYYDFNFNIANGSNARLFEYFQESTYCTNPSVNLSEYSDIYVYMYLKNVVSSGTIKFYLIDQAEVNFMYSKEITIDETSAGKWIKLSVNELFDGGIEAVASKCTNSLLKHFRISIGEGLDADAILGNVMAIGSATLPENSESWNNAQWAAAAAELDLDAYSNTESFVYAFNRIKSGHCRGDQTCNIMDLIRLKKYLAGSEGNQIEISTIAANMNNDESIDSMDLSLLRKMLLGVK